MMPELGDDAVDDCPKVFRNGDFVLSLFPGSPWTSLPRGLRGRLPDEGQKDLVRGPYPDELGGAPTLVRVRPGDSSAVGGLDLGEGGVRGEAEGSVCFGECQWGSGKSVRSWSVIESF
jgi:hypothetical protein